MSQESADVRADRAEDCPTAEVLRRFSTGDLPAPVRERTARHLDECPACESALVALDDADELVELLRRPPIRTEPLPEVAVQRLLGTPSTLDGKGPRTVPPD